MATEKRSLWSRLTNFARKHPVKAAFITAAVVIGIAAFVAGTIATAGLLAGAGAAAAGAGTLISGITAGAFAGAGVPVVAAASVAAGGLAMVVVGARFAAREMARGRMMTAWKSGHSARLETKYKIGSDQVGRFNQLKTGINQFKKDVQAAREPGARSDLQALSNRRAELQKLLAVVKKDGIAEQLSKQSESRFGWRDKGKELQKNVMNDARFHENTLNKYDRLLQSAGGIQLPPPRAAQVEAKPAAGASATATAWKRADVNSDIKRVTVLEERISRIQENSLSASIAPAQKVEMQKAVSILSAVKEIYDDLIKIEKNVAQFRAVKDGLAALLDRHDMDATTLAERLVSQFKTYQQVIFSRIQEPAVRTETHMSVIDATGQREKVNELIGKINGFVNQLEHDHQISASAKAASVLLNANLLQGTTTAQLTKAMHQESILQTFTAKPQQYTIEHANPELRFAKKILPNGNLVSAKLTAFVDKTPIVAQKKSTREDQSQDEVTKPEKPTIVPSSRR